MKTHSVERLTSLIIFFSIFTALFAVQRRIGKNVDNIGKNEKRHKVNHFKYSLGLIATVCAGSPSICLSEAVLAKSLLSDNVDYSIFTDQERRFLSTQVPVFSLPTVMHEQTSTSPNELELTLREIELRKFKTESEEEYIERANILYAELVEHPETFQEKARTLSISRSRFRSGLLTPLTINQLDSELAKEVSGLEPSQLTRPIKVGDSIFILRRESARFFTKPGQ